MDRAIVPDAPIDSVVRLRAVVAYLGERAQHGWWQSAFLSPAGRGFLTAAFVKTLPLAQCSGATAAAARAHDLGIGVGQVHHLFRLPEALEQAIFRAMYEPAVVRRIFAELVDRTAALTALRTVAEMSAFNGALSNVAGPTWVGDAHAVYASEVWARVAMLYMHGFETGVQVYPYFSDRAP
jgi:hypothetical protein